MRPAPQYLIRSYEDNFYAGRCTNGDQALMGLLCPVIALYRFTRNGKFEGRELRPWLYPAQSQDGIYSIFGPVFQKHLRDQVTGWQRNIGFTDDRITIDRFYDDEQNVGITSPRDNSCTFILRWGNDHWMNESGDVEST